MLVLLQKKESLSDIDRPSLPGTLNGHNGSLENASVVDARPAAMGHS